MIAFTKSPRLEAVVRKVIGEVEEHGHLAEANILCLMRDGKWDKYGQASVLSSWITQLFGYDLRVVINEEAWMRMPDEMKEALVDHELSHFEPKIDKEGNKTGWVIRRHDLEEFYSVVARRGAWTEDVRRFVDVLHGAGQLDLFENGSGQLDRLDEGSGDGNSSHGEDMLEVGI